MLLAALLYERADKLSTVDFEDLINFIEQIIDVFSQFLVPFGNFRIDLRCRRLVDFLALTGPR